MPVKVEHLYGFPSLERRSTPELVNGFVVRFQNSLSVGFARMTLVPISYESLRRTPFGSAVSCSYQHYTFNNDHHRHGSGYCLLYGACRSLIEHESNIGCVVGFPALGCIRPRLPKVNKLNLSYWNHLSLAGYHFFRQIHLSRPCEQIHNGRETTLQG